MARPPWTLELVRVGAVPPVLVRQAGERLEQLLARRVVLPKTAVDGAPALDLVRRQYLATRFLDLLSQPRIPTGVKRIGVTNLDLFLPVFTHLYGYAQLGGNAAVVSTFRLCPDDGVTPDLLLERTVKEILHELGHTLGLVHCPASWCAMHPSRWPEEIDLKDAAYCPPCTRALEGGG